MLPKNPLRFPPFGLKPFDVFYKDLISIEDKVNAMNVASLRRRVDLAANNASRYKEESCNYGQLIKRMASYGDFNYPEPPELPK